MLETAVGGEDDIQQQQTSETALKGGSSRGKGRGRRKGWAAPRGSRAGKAAPGPGGDGEGPQEKEQEEEEEPDMGERDPGLWQRCPSDDSGGGGGISNSSSIPTLEGLSLKLSKGMTW